MIAFFRRFRQRLLSENKFSKYLIYAIGEIILVVIGILIALQINNWNEGRKLKQVEVKALKEIREGFKADTIDININIDALKMASQSGSFILSQLNSSNSYHDSLSIHFARSLQLNRLISNDGPYDVLKSKGLDLISNDTLRKQIVTMHDNIYQSMRIWEKGFFVSDRYIQEQCLDLFDVVQFFEIAPTGIIDAKMVPHDFEALKENKRYKTMIKTYAKQSQLFLMYTMRNKTMLVKLLKAIDDELTRLQ